MLTLYLNMLDTQEEKNRFLELYTYYNIKMYRVAYGVLKNEADAEDIVQEAMIAIIENFQSIDKTKSKKTWNYIATIVKNKAINLYHKKQKTVPTEFEEYNYLKQFHSSVVEEKIIKEERSQDLLHGIFELPDLDRDVLYLYYYMELSYKKIAEILNLTEENARQKGKRGRDKLKLILEKGEITNE